MKEKIYLVTGAAGLLGNNIVKQLTERGDKVRALGLPNDQAAEYLPEETEMIYGDITDRESLEQFFDGMEEKEAIVIHCAAIVTLETEYQEKVFDVNVNGTKKIVSQCVDHKVKKLIYVSSTGAIPELPGDEEIREITHFSANGMIGFYSQTKAQATQIVLDAVKETGLDASVVFPTGICGPNDFSRGPATTFIQKYVEGKIPAGIAGYFNAADVRDLAYGCIACADKGRKGEGYIMGNRLVSMREMFKLVSSLTGCKDRKIILPVRIGKIIGKLGDLIQNWTGKSTKMTSFAVYNLIRNNHFSSEKAKRELGYHVRPFSETVRDEISWMKTEGMIS